MYISLRHKIATFVVIVVFTVSFSIIALTQYHQFNVLIKKEQELVKTRVNASMLTIDQWIRSNLDIIEELSLLVEKIEDKKSVEFPHRLKAFAQRYDLKNGVYIGFNDGQFISSAGYIPTRDYDIFKRPWYISAMLKKGRVFVEPYMDVIKRKQIVSFACPVLNKDRVSFAGVISFDLYFDELRSKAAEFFTQSIKGLNVFSFIDKGVGFLILPKYIDQKDAKILERELLAQRTHAPIHQTSLKNKYILIDEHLESINAVIIYPVSRGLIFSSVFEQTIMYFLINILGLLIVLLFVLVDLGKHIKRIESIKESAEQIADGNFDVKVNISEQDELGDLADSFNKMTDNLKRYVDKVKKTTREKQVIEHEMLIARRVQIESLPNSVPRCPNTDIAAMSIPAKSVGGDYYDFIYPQKDKTGFIIADASGKGMSASLYMTNIRSILWSFSEEYGIKPDKMLEKVNQIITKEQYQKDMFITYVYGVYDSQATTFTYANAGHFPPIFYDNKNQVFSELQSTGLPIGIREKSVYEKREVMLNSKDVLVFYTDGIIESMDSKGKVYGISKLKEVIQKNSNKNAQKILEAIKSDVFGFLNGIPIQDDITCIILKRK